MREREGIKKIENGIKHNEITMATLYSLIRMQRQQQNNVVERERERGKKFTASN